MGKWFEIDEALPIIGRISAELCEDGPADRDEIAAAFAEDPEGRKILDSALKSDPEASAAQVARNAVDWFSAEFEKEAAVVQPWLDELSRTREERATEDGQVREIWVYRQADMSSHDSTEDDPKRQTDAEEDRPLNLILYGPPGTGKTYSVQRRAVEIIEGEKHGSVTEEVSNRFQQYLDEGQIEFVTFHPSYAYEEFVEGLRYDLDREIPVVQKGILRRLVERMNNPRPRSGREGSPRVWKISLGDQKGPRSKRRIYNQCIEKGEIVIGDLPDEDLSGHGRQSIENAFVDRGEEGRSGSIVDVNHFVNELKEGDYVAVYNDPKSIRAIGVVDGPYEYREDRTDYPHVRPVEWLGRAVHQVYEMNGSTELNKGQSVYPLDRIPLDEFLSLLPDEVGRQEPHVLIIDEINRGNLPRVFGELITLLEPDKREGAPNEMSTRLPYSQEPFTLPPNLYVIGTMNTADRSIALLDAALRRRFHFEEMMPDAQVLREHLAEREGSAAARTSSSGAGLTAGQADLIVEVFQTLNKRIRTLLDRDHQIGHSYLLGVESMADLHAVWYREVLPLLQEYFYEDERRLTSLLGRYEPPARMGFVETEEPASLLGEEPTGGEPLWSFHEYPASELEEALRHAFLQAGA